MSEQVLIYASFLGIVATCVIAAYTIASYRLSKSIENANATYQSQFSDLLKAIVVSQVLGDVASHKEGFSQAIQLFKTHYTGK
ncbi:MAG: hypothetical protein L3J79_06810, partial [Candidatus Marinimicrobia bacterium]|nr:hypothetical protein [Candidatus Neomarinimicrobiota bacterium]